MKQITKAWLNKNNACPEGAEWALKNKDKTPMQLLALAKKENHLNWCNWGVARMMNRKQQIQYAIYAAEQVIDIYEKKYPNDSRPRKSIEAAKAYLKKPTDENKNAAANAANAAYAAYAANAAYAAAYAAANAANAAYAAAYAANAANAAYAAAYAAANAANAAYAADAMKIKILKYGIELITEGHGRRSPCRK